MTSDSENLKKAYHDAEIAIDAAEDRGLVNKSSTMWQKALAGVRLVMLVEVLLFSRNGQWIRERADRADWEYAQLFGYLTRLAKLEISLFGEDQGWSHFCQLFRHYFGSEIDKLAPSIFLAAVFHPDTIVSRKIKADLENIIQIVAADETAYDSLHGSGIFD